MPPCNPPGECSSMTPSLWPLSRSRKALDFTIFFIYLKLIEPKVVLIFLHKFMNSLNEINKFYNTQNELNNFYSRILIYKMYLIIIFSQILNTKLTKFFSSQILIHKMNYIKNTQQHDFLSSWTIVLSLWLLPFSTNENFYSLFSWFFYNFFLCILNAISWKH